MGIAFEATAVKLKMAVAMVGGLPCPYNLKNRQLIKEVIEPSEPETTDDRIKMKIGTVEARMGC